MAHNDQVAPVQYRGVMVSSTFTDLAEHRAALIRAINGQKLMPIVMENDSAKADVDVVDSSLQMVRDASVYISVISHKYGQIPDCAERNPARLSLTELEFNEARKLGRPILLFIMSEGHAVRLADIERDAEKQQKLDAFRENAKRMTPDSSVHRVYKVFNDLHDFERAAIHAVADLRHHLDEQDEPFTERPQVQAPTSFDKADPIPTPPAFYAEPPYIGSHTFVGRKDQLDTLSDWAAPADSHSILLFEAIGGTGKSMLTWEWMTNHSMDVRGDWAGRFWYSFYEKGAIMADFCRRALAYITSQPLEEFRKRKTTELGEMLLHQLRARSWLLILDGLERVLVAYHRFDAAQLADEDAGTTDQIGHRDPCAAIRPEDDELLRALAAAGPSKLLLTSRLIPRVLLNQASQPIPGVLRVPLPGLRPADAEELLRSCGITGTSQDIQTFLKTHCDCHPLVTGVLAGLINNYLPNRGDFDAWAANPAAGGMFNLAKLDLVQKRNDILRAALTALPEKSRQLLSTLALLSEAVDFQTLTALNPHLPSEPDEVNEPEKPEELWGWDDMSDDDKKQAQQDYSSAIDRRKKYEQALESRRRSQEFLTAPQELARTILDLEPRGLLQYDPQARRYDLHPVVRGIAAGGLAKDDRERYGQRVVDHFSQQAHRPYQEAETLDDVRDGLHVVRTLLQMNRHEQALDAYRGDFSNALFFNLQSHAETLALLRPFFPGSWSIPLESLNASERAYLTSDVAKALLAVGRLKEAVSPTATSLLIFLADTDWRNSLTQLGNFSYLLAAQNRLAKEESCLLFALDLAGLLDNKQGLFSARLDRFKQLANIGQWASAEAMWQLIDPMGRNWSRAIYRPGDAEYRYALYRFWMMDVTEDHIVHAEEVAKAGKNRPVIRILHDLRGQWRLDQRQWVLAAASLHEAIRMAREVGQTAVSAEAKLALARLHLNQLTNPNHEAERLGKAERPPHLSLAHLWLAIGDTERAVVHAIAAYKWAWADGEPYVHRYELNKARQLLDQLGVEIPHLLPHDPDKDEKLPWEGEVASVLEKLRAEKAAEARERE